MNYSRVLLAFAHKYGPPQGTPEYAQFMEDLRVVVVEANLSFRHDQKTGQFTDGTGDKFLSLCKVHQLDPMKEA